MIQLHAYIKRSYKLTFPLSLCKVDANLVEDVHAQNWCSHVQSFFSKLAMQWGKDPFLPQRQKCGQSRCFFSMWGALKTVYFYREAFTGNSSDTKAEEAKSFSHLPVKNFTSKCVKPLLNLRYAVLRQPHMAIKLRFHARFFWSWSAYFNLNCLSSVTD